MYSIWNRPAIGDVVFDLEVASSVEFDDLGELVAEFARASSVELVVESISDEGLRGYVVSLLSAEKRVKVLVYILKGSVEVHIPEDLWVTGDVGRDIFGIRFSLSFVAHVSSRLQCARAVVGRWSGNVSGVVCPVSASGQVDRKFLEPILVDIHAECETDIAGPAGVIAGIERAL